MNQGLFTDLNHKYLFLGLMGGLIASGNCCRYNNLKVDRYCPCDVIDWFAHWISSDESLTHSSAWYALVLYSIISSVTYTAGSLLSNTNEDIQKNVRLCLWSRMDSFHTSFMSLLELESVSVSLVFIKGTKAAETCFRFMESSDSGLNPCRRVSNERFNHMQLNCTHYFRWFSLKNR